MKPNRSLNRGRIFPLASMALPLLLLGFTPISAKAQFTYTTNNGAITITGYSGPGGAVTIPDTINGLPVTGIGDQAYFTNSAITSVAIPNSITNIGDRSFFNCTSLTSANIPNSVTSIGAYAFAACYSMTSAIIGSGVTNMGDDAFEGC